MEAIPVSYDFVLLGLSYVISALSAWTALTLARQLFVGREEDRNFWLASAAFAMGGGGIWSMHFIAMLAYGLPIPVGYDPALTLVSLLAAIVATGIGFGIARVGDSVRCLLAGIPMGIGIAAMHFIGIGAMQLPARMSLSWAWGGVAVVVGVAASAASLLVAKRSLDSVPRVLGALGLAGGVSAMHHSAMLGMDFYPDPDSAVLVPTGLGGPAVAYGVFLITLVILAVALGVTRPLWRSDREGFAIQSD